MGTSFEVLSDVGDESTSIVGSGFFRCRGGDAAGIGLATGGSWARDAGTGLLGSVTGCSVGAGAGAGAGAVTGADTGAALVGAPTVVAANETARACLAEAACCTAEGTGEVCRSLPALSLEVVPSAEAGRKVDALAMPALDARR